CQTGRPALLMEARDAGCVAAGLRLIMAPHMWRKQETATVSAPVLDQAHRPGRGDRWLWAILAGAFLLRWGYGALAGLGTPQGRPFVIDEQEYYLAAQMLAAGH